MKQIGSFMKKFVANYFIAILYLKVKKFVFHVDRDQVANFVIPFS